MIESRSATAKAKIEFRNFTIIDEQSGPAGAAALAAGEQGRGWNFLEIFYRNQGIERIRYADDEFLDRGRQGGGSKTSPAGTANARARELSGEVKATTEEAQQLGFTARRRSRSKARTTARTAGHARIRRRDIEAAIESAG